MRIRTSSLEIRNHFNSYEHNGAQGHHPHSTLSVGWDQREINLTWRCKLLQSLQPIRNQPDWSTYITEPYHNYFDKISVHSTFSWGRGGAHGTSWLGALALGYYYLYDAALGCNVSKWSVLEDSYKMKSGSYKCGVSLEAICKFLFTDHVSSHSLQNGEKKWIQLSSVIIIICNQYLISRIT